MDSDKLYELFCRYGSVSTDSRKCGDGAIFFALKGGNFNGNEYAAAALDNGCSYAVVDEEDKAVSDRYIIVDDCLEALRALAKVHRSKMPAKIIGITGTNGKTTTKELVSAVLSKKYRTRHTEGNLNNHIGVPLTLLSFTPADEMGVVEMGANHPGEIKSSVDIVCPDYGIVTNVGVGHIEGFGSFEGVKKTKGELYDYLRENNRPAFLYADNSDLREMAAGLKCIEYGYSAECMVSGKITDMNPFVQVLCKLPDAEITIQSNLIGDYNLSNILAAVCAGAYFGVPAADIKAAIEEYVPSNKRSQLDEVGDTKFIIDAYNANPTSMAAAIENFAKLPGKRKCAILGDMGELGTESAKEHQKIADLLKRLGFDDVYLVGKNFMHTSDNFVHFESGAQMNDYISSHDKIRQWFEGKMLLVKGSNFMKMGSIVETVKQGL